MDYPEELLEAVSFHENARVAAWFPRPFALYKGGPRVCHLTIERHLALLIEQNKVFLGRDLTKEDFKAEIRDFLFIISPWFSFRRWVWLTRIIRAIWGGLHLWINYPLALEKIYEFIRLERVDKIGNPWTPKGFVNKKRERENAKKKEPWDSLEQPFFVSVLVKRFLDEYGMSERETLKIPYPQLDQKLRAIQKDGSTAAEPYKAAKLWYSTNKKEGK